MRPELHSVFSPSRNTSSSKAPSRGCLPQIHVSTFLSCDSDEESDNAKQEKGLLQDDPRQEMSSALGTTSPDIVAKIKTACSAAARHQPSERNEATSSYRVAHVYGKASGERSLHLRTASRDGAIITNSFEWNSNGPGATSSECGIPRPDSPTI
ncbi:hypothetical protein CABS01_15537 [Colletotrichum abscissum]|uniref:uncharacterized protein n=1 Tax=Colletotrichum abscissum TaxID=1671311 RepID=UPI0027D589E2|nr:uncharacterized protein CABS01_15537 [Colletotrichum abscissum]KAK1475968.1 hypothetical protein CABS01_15537 [Colletotrichum abscissum]